MIHFNKLTPYQSEILSNCEVIGVLERLGATTYHVELLYRYEFTLPVEKKALVLPMIKRIYSRHLKYEARKRMLTIKFIERSKLRPYKQFKIKE